MADIAFLLLIFFLVTTTIVNDQGLFVLLPPETQSMQKLKDRNVLNIRINSADKVLVENESLTAIDQLDERVREFVLNPLAASDKSEHPANAVISIHTDRNTSHRQFIRILDKVHEGYHRIYAERLGITINEWKEILAGLNDPVRKAQYDKARGKEEDGTVLFPMQISIAEPVLTPDSP